MYLTKEDIFKELLSSDVRLRILGSKETRDMVEYDSIKENEISGYIDHLLEALGYDNSQEADDEIINSICFLFDSYNIMSVDLTPFLSIIEGSYRKKKYHADSIVEIIWMFARRCCNQYSPVIQLCKSCKNKRIYSEAMKAEEYMYKNAVPEVLPAPVLVHPISSAPKPQVSDAISGENSEIEQTDTTKSVDSLDEK